MFCFKCFSYISDDAEKFSDADRAKKALTDQYAYLCENLQISGIVTQLIAMQVISRRHKGEIDGSIGEAKKTETFLDILFRTNLQETYPTFRKILAENSSQYGHILKLLDESY